MLAAALVAAAASSGCAQSRCPAGRELTLEQVLGYARQKIDAEITVSRIESCHVSFQMDAPAIQKLVEAHVGLAEMEALGRVTLAQLTAEAAAAQVGGLEQREAEISRTMGAERDAAMLKLAADYAIERVKRAAIAPKGEFESTAEYEKRKRDAATQASVEADKQRQKLDELKKVYLNKELELRAPYQARVNQLQHADYPVAATAEYLKFDADTQRLAVQIGGDVYFFDKVPGLVAQQLKQNWAGVTVRRSLGNDEAQERRLVLAAENIEVSGHPRATAVAQEVARARVLAEAGDESSAELAFQRALAIDPESQDAKAGIAAIQAKRSKQTQFRQKLGEAGIWLHPVTRLMWTRQDSGHGLTWPQAEAYCQALTTGGYLDWRLPVIDELKTIHDRQLTIFPADMGDIKLSLRQVWSGTLPDRNSAWVYNFDLGDVYGDLLKHKSHSALCVRQYSSAKDGLDLPGAPKR